MPVDMQRDTAHIHPLQRSAYSKAVVAELFAQMTVTKSSSNRLVQVCRIV